MSGQQYSDFDSELRFDASPNYGAPPPQGGQAPAFDAFANQSSVQPAWASPSAQQPVYNQGGYEQPYGGNSNYVQFDGPTPGMQPPEQAPSTEEHHHHEVAPVHPKHPIASIFHVLFKVAAILCFFFVGISSGNIVPNIIAVWCLTAADFWTTKNVTGRLLVGLRWWNEVKEDGSSEWVFESLEGKRQIHQSEALIFWGALGINCVLWFVLGVFGVFGLFSLKLLNFQECLVVFVLAMANAIGYFKCARDASNRVKALATSLVVNQAVGYVANNYNNNTNNATNTK